MFSLKRVELVNWDYWSRFTVPLDTKLVTLVGPNGSGKTTFLDACRTLLGIDCAGGRDYRRYARQSKAQYVWIRGIVSNPTIPHRGGRAFFPAIKDDVTLACRIKKGGGDFERKYFICEGDVSIEVISEEGKPIGLHDYRERLASAGLSEAMRRVLALEQGATGNLSEYKPQMLLKLVWETFGDQSVLDQYQRAKQEYEHAERELKEAEFNADRQALAVSVLAQEVQQFQEWDRRRERLLDWQTRLLLVKEIEELIERTRDARDAQRKARAKRRENAERLRCQKGRLGDLCQLRDQKQRDQKTAEEAVRSALAARDGCQQEYTKAETLLNEREKLARLVEAQRAGTNPVALANELAECRMAKYTALNEQAELSSQRTRLELTIGELRAGRRQHAPEIQALTAALATAGISHTVLADVVELIEPGWQEAAEAVLADHRGTVVLENVADRARALEISAAHRYPHRIAWALEAARPVPSDRLLAKLTFSGRMPSAVLETLASVRCVQSLEEGATLEQRDPDATWVTADGFYRDRYGARHAAVAPSAFVLGRQGVERALDAALSSLADVNKRAAAAEAAINVRDDRISEIEALLHGYDAASQLVARAEEFRAAEESATRWKNELAAANNVFERAQADKKMVDAALLAVEKDITKQESEIEKTEGSLNGATYALDSARAAVREFIGVLRTKLDGAPADWHNASTRATIAAHADCASLSVSIFKKHIDDESAWVKENKEGKDKTVVLRHEKQHDELTRLRGMLEERQAMRTRTLTLVDEQRARYINVLKGTVSAYLANVKTLAEMAGIEAIDRPFLIENTDVSLAQAGLEVVFRFDQKAQADFDASDSSGGQKVMKSMILLVALMLDDRNPSGVVFADEPFAQLDILNIDRVTGFLKKTNAQFILTTPITYNRNIYSPARITLVTRTLRPHERHAPPIAVAIRREGAV